jgi:hypothetical protein
MRLPRVRLTVRTMMALVAVVAVLLAGSPLVAQRVTVSLRYREMAAYCSKVEATYRSYERLYLTELQDSSQASGRRLGLTSSPCPPRGRRMTLPGREPPRAGPLRSTGRG